MGTQIHAGENYRRVVEIVKAGQIGPVSRVHVWMGGGIRPGVRVKEGTPPATVDYDLWIGPAPMRPFRPLALSFQLAVLVGFRRRHAGRLRLPLHGLAVLGVGPARSHVGGGQGREDVARRQRRARQHAGRLPLSGAGRISRRCISPGITATGSPRGPKTTARRRPCCSRAATAAAGCWPTTATRKLFMLDGTEPDRAAADDSQFDRPLGRMGRSLQVARADHLQFRLLRRAGRGGVAGQRVVPRRRRKAGVGRRGAAGTQLLGGRCLHSPRVSPRLDAHRVSVNARMLATMILRWLRERRRRKLLATPFPAQWLRWLERNVAHYPHLSAADQARLRDRLRVFVAEKNWEGCAGLQVTDEMKVTIAAQACLMTLGLDGDPFDGLLSILIYPSGYAVPEERWHEGWSIAGYSARRAKPTIADRSFSPGMTFARTRQHPGQGNNLVWHEFAHQIDMLDRSVNGTPPLEDRSMRRQWHDVMTRRVRTARRRRRGRPRHVARHLRRRKRSRVLRRGHRVLLRLPGGIA